MAGASEELPPLVQDLIARYDVNLSQRAFESADQATQDALRKANATAQRIADAASKRASDAFKAHTRRMNALRRESAKEQERLALNAGKREGEIVKATSREVVAVRRQAATQELEVQRKASTALVAHQRKGMAAWEETIKRSYFRMKGAYRKAQQDQQQAQDKANRDQQQGQQKANQRSQQQQARSFKVWYVLFDDYLKRRRARERAQQFEDLAAQKAADRRKWQEQKSADSERLAAQKAAYRRQSIDQQAAAARSVNAHKAMWSIIRTTTETGGRFMSSITQSALRSMGSAVGIGLRRITGTYRDAGNANERALRESFATQQAITTRALAKQQGTIAAFQNTAQRGALGSIMNLRNLALGGAGFLSARAIFGPVADYQQTQIAFQALLGSAERAERFLTQMRNFAEVTPFDFAGVSEGARRLLAVGFAARDVIPALTDIGNVAANLGAGTEEINGVIRALGQMKGKGKASAEELNQISEQLPGFSAVNAIAESLGITVAETFDMMKKGALPADVAIQAILQGMRDMPGAAGAMERQSRTLNGRLSTLKDTLQNLVIDAMQPFIGSISDAVGRFTELVTSLFRGKGVWAVVRSGLLGLALALGAIAAQKGAVAIMQLMGTALKVIAANPLIAFVVAVTTLATILYRHNDTFREFVDGFLGRVVEFVTRYSAPVIDAFRGVAESIGELAAQVMDGDWRSAATFLSDFFTESWDNAVAWVEGGGIGELADRVRERITTAFQQVVDSPAANWLVDFGTEAWLRWQEWLDSGGLGDLAESIGGRISSAFSALSDVLSDVDWDRVLGPALAVAGVAVAGLVLGWPVAIGGALIAGIIALSPRLRDGLTQLFERAQEWISDAFDRIDWMKVGTTILEGLRRFGEFLGGPVVGAIFSETGLKIMGAIAIGIVAGAGAIALGFFQGLSQSSPKIDEAIGNILDELLDKLRDWIRGLDGIWGALAQTIIGPFQFIFGVISDGFDALGEVLEGWRDIVTGIFAGDWGQVFDGFKHVWWALFQFLSDVVSRFLTWAYDSFSRLGSTLWGAAVGGLTWVKDRFFAWGVAVINFWSSIPRTMADAFTGFGGLVMDAIKAGFGAATGFAASIVNSIIDLVNREVIDRISGITIDPPGPGPTFNVPDLPHIPHVELAKGGIVTKPTLALIGEAGPEAVIPLSGNAAGSIPFTISFDASMIAAQVDAIVSIMAPMGERLVAATTPGMRMWANAVERVLGRILSGFETWGDRMVSLAVSISAAITAGITDGLREGRSEVVRITRGYARSLVGALNPLLTGIGETPIELNFAKGGIAEAHHGAQVHVFNEGRRGRGSSHGEAYIPFDPTNRTRSRELAAETARRLGGNVQWFADGGITTPTIQSGQLVPGVTGDVVGLVAEFARRLSTWSLANGGGYHVGSGYRSIEEQTRLYQRYLAGVPGQAPAAPPGRSMHNFGLASDGNHWRNLRPEEFGLRFPMSYEPWHVEPAEGKALLGDTDFPSFQPLPRPPEAGQRGWLSQVAAKLMAYVYDKTLAYAGGLSYSGTTPTLGSASASPAILAAIRQAMGIVGVPASWLGPLLTLISRESSFNPNAYNSILGASGLMQTIPSTFAAYALPGYGGIFDPLANVIAGLRYILSRYGSIFNVGQAVSSNPTRGYSYGGVVDREGMYRLAEGNKREVVLPLENRGRLMELLRRTGLADTIALAAANPIDMASVRPDSATSRSGPNIESVIGEMHVHSNAIDPVTVADISARKVDRQVRDVLTGVGF